MRGACPERMRGACPERMRGACPERMRGARPLLQAPQRPRVAQAGYTHSLGVQLRLLHVGLQQPVLQFRFRLALLFLAIFASLRETSLRCLSWLSRQDAKNAKVLIRGRLAYLFLAISASLRETSLRLLRYPTSRRMDNLVDCGPRWMGRGCPPRSFVSHAASLLMASRGMATSLSLRR